MIPNLKEILKKLERISKSRFVRVVGIVLNTRVIILILLRLNKLERSKRTPNHLFVCKFKRNIETIRMYLQIKICASYRHGFEYAGDNIDSFEVKQARMK